MSIGLLIKDADGRVIIGPDTFTVRYVATFKIPAGTWGTAKRFAVPQAKAGMFAAGCALGGYSTGFSLRYGYADYAGSELCDSLPRMPAFRVGDGWVEAFPPGGSSTRWDGNVQVMVFTAI